MPSRLLIAATLVLASACASDGATPAPAPSIEARVAALIKSQPLVDGHNDLVVHYLYCGPDCPRGVDGYDLRAGASGDTDIARWRQGGVGGQLLNAGWLSDEAGLEGTLKGLAFARELVARHPEDLALARTAADLRRAHAEGRIGVVLALEHPGRLGEDEATVARLAAEGLRANILAYDAPTALADGHAGPATHGGLSPLGEKMVGWMQRHGILVDLSHASADTARDVLAIATSPVVFSHSNAAALADVPRNVPDDVLRRLPANGGVVMVSFAPYFTSAPFAAWMARGDAFWEQALARHGGDRAHAGPEMARWEADHPPPAVGIADVADHIEHIRDVAGVDHVGLGADFDGIAFKVAGLEDVAGYPRLLEELARRGWSDGDLAKLAGGNFLRVLAAADAVVASRAIGDPVEGARIARRVGCDGCHGEGGIGKVFMEDAEQGRIVAPNLTQRRTLYTDDGLAALLHEGKTHDGHAPWGMPIQSFQHLSHREVRDIIAWLRALPAVEDPALPAGRWSDQLKQLINDGTHPWLGDLKPSEGNVPPDAPPTEPLALGRHLALTTCSECHGWDLKGFGDPGAPPPLAIAKAYSDEQFARLMRTGEVLAGGKSASGLMTGVAKYRFNAMTDAEIQALKDYLDSL